jgi:hypothetical protein
MEPIFYMGIIVGYVRKYDSKLQIEMLRAYKPDTFKTAGVQVNIGQQNVFRLTEDQRHRLIEYNRQWLLTAPIEADGGQPAPPLNPKELRIDYCYRYYPWPTGDVVGDKRGRQGRQRPASVVNAANTEPATATKRA